ncbi:hypothetical protein BKI52_04740 [marine bacterium AO1-C]|nr:hypothetical protein BKI52_04740 [marine bacterium AO1-C]
MKIKAFVLFKKNIFLGTTLLIITLLMNACSLKPTAWKPPTKPEFKGKLSLNNQLQHTQKINLQGWYGPEDIVMDGVGNLYCGVHKGSNDFSDGRILKISPKGKIEVFYDAGSWVAGLHFDQNQHLVALSHRQGLISIAPDKTVTVLANADEKGQKFLIPNGLDISSDGTIYFSNTSHQSAYSLKYGKKLILEIKPQGGLYAYNPRTQKVTTLLQGTYFGNGVVLSKNEDFLLMTETSKYRIIRYWLKGSKKGTQEVFMDNLPGFPNGISIRADGSFWLGFTTKRNNALDKIHHKTGTKKLVYALPGFLQPKPEKFGMILQISEQGEILQALFDPTGKQVPEAGAVKEYKGKLYIGGDVVPYITIYSLETVYK